jgi:hypothetical protein
VSLRTQIRLGVFVAVSLTIHLLVISELGGWSAAPREDKVQPLSAELVPAEPPTPPKPAAKPVPPVPPEARPAQQPKPTRIPPPRVPPKPAATVAAKESAPAAPDSNEAPQTQAGPEARDDAASGPAPTPSAQPAPATESDEPAPAVDSTASTAPVRDLPRGGSIQYEMLWGPGRFPVGRTVHTWEIGARTYQMSSISETTGLARVFRPNELSYFSEGRIDANGFRPEQFWVRRGRDSVRQYGALFDWKAKEIELGPVAATRKLPLPAGTQDILSLIFQLVRSQLLPGRVQLHVTTGNKLDLYSLDIGAEEYLELPTGRLRAVPVRQVRRTGEESIELYLAPERHYLPVLIRFLDRNGAMSGEQIAVEISTTKR